MKNNELNEVIKSLNKVINEEPEALYMCTLEYHSSNDINYIVDRLHLDEATRENFRVVQHRRAEKHQENEQVQKALLLREQKLREVYIKFDEQANTLPSISDRTMMLDTIVVSINQLIHDPVINPISPIEAVEINDGLEIFFTSTYFNPDEIHYVIDHLDLKEKENFREEIRKEQIAKEPARTAELLNEERKEKRRKQIAEKAQQFIADPSTTLVTISEVLKELYSQLPYKLENEEVCMDLNTAIELFKVSADDINNFLDLFDLNNDSREKIKETQSKRFEKMRNKRNYYLHKKIEEIGKNNSNTKVHDIISVLREEMDHPVIPLTLNEVITSLELVGTRSLTLDSNSRSLQTNNSTISPLTEREINIILHALGLITNERNEPTTQRMWVKGTNIEEREPDERVRNMISYVETHLPQFLENNRVLDTLPEQFSKNNGLSSLEREVQELISESIKQHATSNNSVSIPEQFSKNNDLPLLDKKVQELISESIKQHEHANNSVSISEQFNKNNGLSSLEREVQKLISESIKQVENSNNSVSFELTPEQKAKVQNDLKKYQEKRKKNLTEIVENEEERQKLKERIKKLNHARRDRLRENKSKGDKSR